MRMKYLFCRNFTSETLYLWTNLRINSFHPLQLEVIRELIDDWTKDEKRDQLIVCATGYGKSLIYQNPPVHQNKLVIVISPLNSLIEDQVFFFVNFK